MGSIECLPNKSVGSRAAALGGSTVGVNDMTEIRECSRSGL